MNDVFQEVQEEIKNEQILSFFKKYQNYFYALCFLIIAGTAGWKWYQYEKGQTNLEASRFYANGLQLLLQDKPKEALKLLESLPRYVGDGYDLLAAVAVFDILKDTSPDQVQPVFDKIVSMRAKKYRAIQNLVRIKYGYFLVDQGHPQKAQEIVKPLLENEAWGPFVHEIYLLCEVLQSKSQDQKQELMRSFLKREDLSKNMQQRIKILSQSSVL